MKEKKDYTVEELLVQLEIMKKTIKVQHETINRLMDTYVLKEKSSKNPKNSRRQIKKNHSTYERQIKKRQCTSTDAFYRFLKCKCICKTNPFLVFIT